MAGRLPPGARPNDVCSVCQMGQPTSENGMIYCDGKCAICVHQECYGIAELPNVSKWYCKRCEPYSMVRSSKIKCIACPERTGALKETTGHEEFCHVVCALWLPGVSFGELKRMQPINLRDAPATPPNTCCQICHKAGKPKDISASGMTAPCAHAGCEVRMHVTCAQSEDLLVVPAHRGKMIRGQKDRFQVLCHAHRSEAPARPKQKPQVTEAVTSDGTTFHLHDHVKAFWKGGRQLYSGTITAINPDRTFAVTYHDGDYEATVPGSSLRPMLSIRSAKHAAAKTMAQQTQLTKKTPSASRSAQAKTAAVKRKASVENSPPAPSKKAATAKPAVEKPVPRAAAQPKAEPIKPTAVVPRPVILSKPVAAKPADPKPVTPKPIVPKPAVVAKQPLVRSTKSPDTPTREAAARPTTRDRPRSPEPLEQYRSLPLIDQSAITPNETPTADALLKSVQKFWKDGTYPLYKFLFRGHPGADPDLFQRMEDAKTNQAVLAERVAVLETENKRLLDSREALFGKLPQPPTVVLSPDVVFGTNQARALRDTLITTLGIEDAVGALDSESLQKLDEQVRIISESVTGLIDVHKQQRTI